MADYIVVHGIRIANEFTPETFGRLTTIGPVFWLTVSPKRRRSFQVCECSCGAIRVICTDSLRCRRPQSCGCANPEITRKCKRIHGGSKSVEYRVWNRLYLRCCKPESLDYVNYGGRGIAVCDRWREPNGQGFINFLADMGERPSKDHSIDRIDVNGNYEPGNCRWATRKEQNKNMRKSYLIVDGKKFHVDELAKEYGISPRLIHKRLRQGWNINRALDQPVRSWPVSKKDASTSASNPTNDNQDRTHTDNKI